MIAPSTTGLEWSCRRCGWHGVNADATLAMHPAGYGYHSPLCPRCGSYFNEFDMAAALGSSAPSTNGAVK